MEDYTNWRFEELCSNFIELKTKIEMAIKTADDELFLGNFFFTGFFVNDNLKKAATQIARLDYLISELKLCWFHITRQINVKEVSNDIIVIIFSFLDPFLDFEKSVFDINEEHQRNLELLNLAGGRRELIKWL